MKTKLLLILLLGMIFICSCNVKKVENTNAVYQTIKDKTTNTKVSFYRYTSEDFEFKGSDTPLIVVLAGSTKFTDENINNYLDNGFKDIADEEECNIIFVNPKKETWSQFDVDRINAIMANSTEVYLPNLNYDKGVNSKGQFYSSHFRKYIFTIGESAAGFVSTYLENTSYKITEWSNASSGGYGAGTIRLTEGFDKTNVINALENAKGKTRTYLNDGVSFLEEFYYFEDMMEVEEYTFKSKSGKKINYYEYNKNESNEKRPLVVLFHGRGTSPLTYIQQTKWPLYALENNFTVLVIEGPYDMFYSKNVSKSLTKATNELIMDYVNNNNIDSKRVYLSGFSMGAYRSLALGQMYPENYAGIAVNNIVTSKNIEIKNEIPTFVFVGTEDFYNNNASKAKWFRTMISSIAKCNGTTYTYDETINNIWGYNFTDTDVYKDSDNLWEMTINKLNDKTYLVDCSNLSHNVLPYETEQLIKFFNLVK